MKGYSYDRRAYSYDRSRIALSVGSTEPWRSDLRKMTRIYKSIPTATEDKRLELFLEGRGLFATFNHNFEAWVYDDLLPSREPKKQNWREQQVAKTAWTALMTISGLFPDSWNYKNERHEPAPYELERSIDKNIVRYQRAFNVALKEIDELLREREQSGKVRLQPVELLHVGPVQVVVHNQGREERPSMEEDLDDELRTLKDAVHRIEHAGFPQAVKGLTVHISFVQTALRAGHYDSGKDELFLFPLGTGREDHETLIHECGHRFYYKSLPANARAHWKEVVDARALTIEDADIDHMIAKYIEPAVKRDGWTPSRDTLRREIHEGSAELEAKCRELSDHVPSFTSDVEEIRSFWKKHYSGSRINLEEISDYGSTNDMEAFAEAFMLYVVRGPGALGPWTQNFFKAISRSGGARLASPPLGHA